YNILIMSDPQAWRLQNGLNPNKDRKEWETVNQKVSDSINILNDVYQLKFGIINGDITEFGRKTTWESFDKIYTNNIKFPLYIGLGNHDYANNVGDCWGKDCARNSFLELIRRMNVNYKYTLENFNFDYDEKKRIGSGAYSWDMGDVHYVQLNNYPTYFENLGSVKVTKSTEWLDKDLSEAYRRGKATILNFHDSYDHIAEKKYTSDKEKEKLEKMIKDYNVIAIFSGHSHFSGFTVGYLRGVINYDSGALFKGDYLLVSVVDKCIEVEVYNGFSGQPVRVKRLGKECGD
ncbi:metallophosphoesterase, partial [Providencia rettgeri]|uniref:metallophosphoesterase n=3 Tax=Providencia TaxID=586 RepID=UPI001B361930